MSLDNESVSTESKSPNYIKEILQWIQAVIFAVAIALLIRGFVFELVKVEGPSMENTLYTSQKLFVYKLGYMFSPPKRGDIIVLQYQEGIVRFFPYIDNIPFLRKTFPALNEVDYIKRVIALPDDTIDIRDGHVYVNGNLLDESYAKGLTYPRGMTFPQIVPRNKVFVLGDNRENSSDSRQIGFIDYGKIKGKAVFRLLPITDFGKIE